MPFDQLIMQPSFSFVDAGILGSTHLSPAPAISLASFSPSLTVHWPFRTGHPRQDSGLILLSGCAWRDDCPLRLTAPEHQPSWVTGPLP